MLIIIFIIVRFLFFKKNIFWLGQNFIFFICFIFIIKSNLNLYLSQISFFLGLDILSYGLILLRFWICGLIIIAREKIFKYKNKCNWFIFIIFFLLIILIFTFRSLELLLFYIFFESRLIPTLFLILGWGYQPERLQAGVYLLFYTLFASLPLLLGIFYNESLIGGSINYLLSYNYENSLIYFCLIIAFLVKMPIFFVHLWLPKAHVEAPVSGSIILAGVLLKLGGYGLLRVYILIQSLAIKFNIIFYVISLVGGVLISLVCLIQVDIKALIAYSSVAHMGVVIRGLITLSLWGFWGSYVLMIGHGLCSSGLFCLSNIVYERTNSRSLLINKGLINFMPSLSLWWFLLSSRNIAAPPSLNLVGEIFLFNSIISWSWLRMYIISLVSFFRAAYSLYLFAISQHGDIFSLSLSFNLPNVRENLVLMLHWVPLNLLIFKPDFFLYCI